jgi:hypothetical protein
MLILGLVVILPLSSIASDVDPEDKKSKKNQVKEDSLGLYEAENKTLEADQVPDYLRVTPNVQPTPTKVNHNKVTVEEVVNEENDNSAMSFNFIYYIIDTFKFADPLE